MKRCGEHYFAFDGVSAHICAACVWRTVAQTDLTGQVIGWAVDVHNELCSILDNLG